MDPILQRLEIKVIFILPKMFIRKVEENISFSSTLRGNDLHLKFLAIGLTWYNNNSNKEVFTVLPYFFFLHTHTHTHTCVYVYKACRDAFPAVPKCCLWMHVTAVVLISCAFDIYLVSPHTDSFPFLLKYLPRHLFSLSFFSFSPLNLF